MKKKFELSPKLRNLCARHTCETYLMQPSMVDEEKEYTFKFRRHLVKVKSFMKNFWDDEDHNPKQEEVFRLAEFYGERGFPSIADEFEDKLHELIDIIQKSIDEPLPKYIASNNEYGRYTRVSAYDSLTKEDLSEMDDTYENDKPNLKKLLGELGKVENQIQKIKCWHLQYRDSVYQKRKDVDAYRNRFGRALRKEK